MAPPCVVRWSAFGRDGGRSVAVMAGERAVAAGGRFGAMHRLRGGGGALGEVPGAQGLAAHSLLPGEQAFMFHALTSVVEAGALQALLQRQEGVEIGRASGRERVCQYV